jgi:AMP deaminase
MTVQFNAKYNPAGQSLLREVFLKSSNKLKGKYLAELTKEVFTHLEETVDERVELRISIYGRNRNEWSLITTVRSFIVEQNEWLGVLPRFELSDWIVDNQLYSGMQ